MNSARWGDPNYSGLLAQTFEAILSEISSDLDRNISDKNYITDETADILTAVERELSLCGCNGSLTGQIDALSWFVGGDPAKIQQLQSLLNELGVGGHLLQDGVYGKETLAAWNQFTQTLASGSVPVLGFINPLQSNLTGITHGLSHGQKPVGGILDYYSMSVLPNEFDYSVIFKNSNSGKQAIFRLDRPHYENGKPVGYHMNLNIDVPSFAQKYFYNGKEISEQTYLMLKNFRNIAKPVRIVGRTLLVAGIALDALEIGSALDAERKDTNGKLEQSTVSTIARIGGRWTGAALGAKGGALAGAAAGTAAFPVVGTAIGGVIGGLIGGVVGSYTGSELAQWIVDITCLED